MDNNLTYRKTAEEIRMTQTDYIHNYLEERVLY